MSKQPEVPTAVPRTREELEKALAERKALSTMLVPPKEPAGQAPAGTDPKSVGYVEAPRPAAPPAPEVNVGPIEKLRASKLAEIEAKVARRQAVKIELVQQQKNQAALIKQMKADEAALAAESEALEAEVGQIQRELAAVEAQHLAKAALRDQAARGETERLPLKAWQSKWREELVPLQQRIVGGLRKLQAILRDRGATLETVAALRSQPGLDNDTRSTYIAVSTTAGNLLTEIHDAIVAHERALAHAEDFLPDPSSPDGVSAINGLRYELETVTGVTTGKLVDIVNPRVVIPAGVGIEGSTPAAAELEHRIAELLTQYASVQKRVNRVARPEIIITLKPKEERPRHETMAALRGPKPEQTRAAGVPEGA